MGQSDLSGLSAFPFPVVWHGVPLRSRILGPSSLEITAGSRTDLFINPQGTERTLNAPRLLARVAGNFQLVSHVSVDFAAAFDAGVLILWLDDDRWAKLCFEYSPQGTPMVVSVITKGRSDDANAFTTPDRAMWLRVS